MPKQNTWLEFLSTLASNEQDPEKLLALMIEIDRVSELQEPRSANAGTRNAAVSDKEDYAL